MQLMLQILDLSQGMGRCIMSCLSPHTMAPYLILPPTQYLSKWHFKVGCKLMWFPLMIRFCSKIFLVVLWLQTQQQPYQLFAGYVQSFGCKLSYIHLMFTQDPVLCSYQQHYVVTVAANSRTTMLKMCKYKRFIAPHT